MLVKVLCNGWCLFRANCSGTSRYGFLCAPMLGDRMNVEGADKMVFGLLQGTSVGWNDNVCYDLVACYIR